MDALQMTVAALAALVTVGVVVCAALWVRFHRANTVDVSLAQIAEYHGYRPKSRALLTDLVVVFDMEGKAKTYPVYRPGMREAYAVVLEAATGRPFRGPFAWGRK